MALAMGPNDEDEEEETNSWSRLDCHSVGNGADLSLRLQRTGPEVNHSPSSSCKAKNEWSYTSSPPICLCCVEGTTLPFLPITLLIQRTFQMHRWLFFFFSPKSYDPAS